ncbi:MAG: hypothetical protein K8U57_00355 [Planctomycetes bacterium]|nr:hypothetical protein [Planctomycetota bacterium]
MTGREWFAGCRTERLQQAARELVQDVYPGAAAESIQVLDRNGRVLALVAVPAGVVAVAPSQREEPEVIAGWTFTDHSALFDGKRISVAASRLKLLRVLVEAEGPLSGKMIAELAFGKHMGEDAARYHITSLRKELGEAFPEFEGEFIPGDGGYRLMLR